MQTQSNPINRKWHKIITWLTIASFFAQPTAAVFAATPELHAAANGVPIVEINTPSAGGVSHNQFDRFDVNQNGLIFNNSAGMVNTQLAGYIMGNGNLGRGPAKIILTEVMGTRPTNLNGYMEIAGKRADLIIANPNGIQGSGFGFINTARATLATGKPILGAGGTLEGFNVSGGKITIQGSGMDASATTRVDLLARAVEINAGIWAQDLNVITGANQIDSKTLTTTTLTKIKPQQGVAIDVGALGGMYAGKIKLIGTESGVGVNSRGIIQAGTDLALNSQGKITLTGTTLAGNNLAISAREGITNQETLYAKEQLTLESAGKIENSGLLGAGSSLAITAGDSLKNSGTAFAEKTLQLKAANINNTEGYIEAGQLALKTQSINNTKGKILQLGNANLAIEVSGTLDNTAGELAANAGGLRLSAGQIQNQGGKILHGGQGKLAIGAQGQLENNEGTIRTNGNIQIAAKNLANRQGEIFSAGTADIDIAEKLGNAGGSLASGNALVLKAKAVENKAGNIEAATLQLTANVLDNGDKGRIVSTGISQMQVEVKNKLTNQGLIGSNGALKIDASEAINQNGQITAEQTLSLTAETFNNTKASLLLSGGKLSLMAANEIENQGAVIAAADTVLTAKNIVSGGILEAGIKADGTLAGEGNLVISATETAAITGKNLAAKDLKITADNSSLANSETLAGRDLVVNAKSVTTRGAVVSASQKLTMDTENLENQTGQIAADQITLSSNMLDNSGGKILHYGKADLIVATTGTLDNNGGQIAANATKFTIKAGEINNQSGTLTQAGSGSANITAMEDINNEAGKIQSGGALHIASNGLDNQNGSINAAKEANLDISGKLDNTTGLVASSANLNLKAAAIENQGGDIEADTLNIQSGSLHNGEAGRIVNLGESEMQLAAIDKLTNQGLIGSNGKVQISANQIINQDGQITAKEDLSLKADTLKSTKDGTLLSGSNLIINAAKAIENQGAVIAAGDNILTAKNIISSGTLQAGVTADGTISAKGNLIVNANETAAITGKNLAANDLKIRAEHVDLTNAETLAGRDLAIVSTKGVTTRGAVVSANQKLTIDAENLENQKGQIAADKIVLSTNTLNNNSGKILHYGKEALTIAVTGTLDNNGGEIAANAENFTVKAGAINNQNGMLTQAGQGMANITATEDINNEAGKIQSGGALHIASKELDNQNGSINAAQEANLDIAEKLDNTTGAVASSANLNLKAAAIENQGGDIEADTLNIQSGSLHNGKAGRIVNLGESEMQLAAIDKLTNQGLIGGNGKVQISADQIVNQDGQITAKQDLTLTADTLNNTKDGTLLSGSNLIVNAAQAIETQGAIIANGNNVLAAKNINSGGILQAGIAADGTIAKGNLIVNANEMAAITGKNLAANDLKIRAEHVDLTNAETLAGRDLAIASTKGVTTRGAVVSASQKLTIDAENLENQKGQIVADKIVLSTNTLNNNGGKILHYGKEALTIAVTGTLDNNGGEIAANAENFMVKAGAINNQSGTLTQAGSGSANITAMEDINNEAGKMQSGGALHIASKELDNQNGSINAVKEANLDIAGKLDNTAGLVASSANLNLKAAAIDNQGGDIEADTLNIQSGSLHNGEAGRIVNLGESEMQLAAIDKLTNQGLIGGNGKVQISADQIVNQNGQITAKQDLTLTADTLNNTKNGTLLSGGNLTIDAAKAIENQGAIIAEKDNVLTAKHINSDGSLQAGIAADGTIAKSGNLIVSATETATLTGQNLAAEDLKITAASIDLATSETLAGQDLTIRGAKDVTTSGAVVSARQNLTIDTENLQNKKGQIAADQVAIATNTLNNSGGKILHYSKTAFALDIKGKLDNTAGEIAANADNFTIKADQILNAKGKITQAGTGLAELSANLLDNTQGEISANGSFAVSAETIDNDQGSIAAQKQAAMMAKTLNNSNGTIETAQGLTINTAQLNNAANGKIANLSGTLAIAAKEALNNSGTIGSNGNLTLESGQLINQGQISSQNDLEIVAADLKNQNGTLLTGKALTAKVAGTLENSGILQSGDDLSLTAQAINSTGTLAAGIDSNGQIKETGALTIKAETLTSTGKNLAGQIKLEGKQINLNNSTTYAIEDLALSSQGAISTAGANLFAGGKAELKAKGTLNNRVGQIQAGVLTLEAASLDNSKGKILQYKDSPAAIATTGTINNTNGQIAANGAILTIKSDNLDNTNGEITHAGAQELKITTDKAIDNTAGNIHANGALGLNAENLNTRQGEISARTEIKLTLEKDLQNQAGKIVSDGQITITAKGNLDNTEGTLAGNQGLGITAKNLNNGQGGNITGLGEGGISLTVKETLTNSGAIAGSKAANLAAKTIRNQNGRISSEQDLALETEELTNAADIIAGGNLTLTVQGKLKNDGSLLAGSDVKLDAGSIASTGTIGAGIKADGTLNGSGDLTIRSTGEAALNGKNLAGGNFNLAASQVNLNGAQTVASKTAAITTAGDINNQNGSLNAGEKLTLTAGGSIINETGVITAGNLTIDAGNLNNKAGKIFTDQSGTDQLKLASELDNTSGEILLGGNYASIQAKTLNNESGKIAQFGTAKLVVTLQEGLANRNGQILTNADLTVNAQAINNQQGTISAQKDTNLTGKNAMNNAAGKILSGGALRLTTEHILDNSDGKIEAGKGLRLEAAAIDNKVNGQILSLGTEDLVINAKQNIINQGTIAGNGNIEFAGKTLENTQGKISAGSDVHFGLTDDLTNAAGSIYAGNDIKLQNANLSVNNNSGSIEAKQNLNLSAKELQNADGKIIAGGNLSLVTPILSGGGTLQAGNDMHLTFAGDYKQKAGSSFTANGSLNLSTTGDITNEGIISAVKDLSLSASNVTNKETGVLTANQNLTIKADKNLQNHGRIDAETIDLTAKDLVNTGAVIGANLTVHTNTLENSTSQAILATTEGMNLFVKDTLENKDHATIYSLGNIEIAADGAQNKTSQVINQSATIEAGKDIGIHAEELTNKRSVFETEEVEVSSEDKVEVISSVSRRGGEGKLNYDNIDKKYTEVITETKVKNDSGAARIIAGNDIAIDSDQITNKISEIKAGNNLSIQSDEVNNITADIKRTVNNENVKIIYSGNEWFALGAGNGTGGGDTGWKNNTYYRENNSPNETVSIESIPGYAAILEGKQSVTINAKNINNITTNPEAIAAGNATTLAPGTSQAVQGKQKETTSQNVGAVNAAAGTGHLVSDIAKEQGSGHKQTANAAPGAIGATTQAVVKQQQTPQQVEGGQHAVNLGSKAEHDQTKLDSKSPDIGQSAVIGKNQTITGSIATGAGKVSGSLNDISQNIVASKNQSITGGAITTLPGLGQNTTATKTAQTAGNTDLGTSGTIDATTDQKKTDAFAKTGVNPGFDFGKLPVNGLFSIRPEPTSKYLVETDKRFTDYKTFLSSDYLLGQVGYDPAKALKRLGDGFYEQQLVRDQIEAKTGQLFLEGYTNNEEQYKELLNNGIKVAQDFELTLGIALSPEQVNALKEDIVWLVEQEIQGQNVLVPVVYLAPGNAVLNPSGAVIQGNNVTLNAEEKITNTGNIMGDQTKITGENILNRGGTISGGVSLDLTAEKDILNQSGTIKGGEINLNAGRDIKNQTVTSPVNFGSGEQTLVSQTAQIKAEGNLNINAGQDFTNQGSQTSGADIAIDAGRDLTVGTVAHQGSDYFTSAKTQITSQITAEGNLSLNAGKDLTLESAKATAGKDLTLKAGQDVKITTTVNTVNKTGAEIVIGNLKQTSAKTNVTTDLTAGKSITIESGNDLTLKGAKVNAGDTINITSGGDLTLTSEKDERKTQIHNKIKGGWEHTKTADEQTVSTDLNAKNNITLTANGKDSNILIQGSNAISENGKISLASTNNITIKETTEQHESEYTSHTRKSGFLSSKTTDKHDYNLENDVIGSNLSGDSIEIKAGQDLNIKGSNVVGTNDVDLSAGGDVNIESAAKTGIEEHESQTKKSGLFSGGGLGFTIGKRTEKDSTKENVLANQASTIGSVEGNVTIKAGEKVDIEGSNLIAKEDIDITGKQVNIDNSTDTYDYERKYELKQSGLSVSLGGKIINTAMDTVQNAEKSTHVEGDRLAALYGYETAKDIKNLGKELDGVTGKNAKDHISVNISIGSSKTTLEEKAYVETVNPSDIRAGNNVNITATKGDIDLTATKITGKDIELNAKENIHIESAQNKQNSESKMESNSWSLGYDIGGGISGSYNKGSNKENEKNTAHVGSEIKAENEVNINSGKDTNIIGSTVAGEKVTATIGGDLNIESKQDEKTYDQSGKNFGIGIGGKDQGIQGGIGKNKTESDYQSVTNQAGIHAGKEGFDIEVGKNTDLKGGVIASGATPDKNKISTDTLTYGDIENKAEYSASSNGININTAAGAEYNEKGVTPNIGVKAEDEANSTTKSAIAEGTIEIRSDKNKDLSDLSRDTEKSLNQLGEIFDKKTVEEKQELAEVFGKVAFEEVHRISKQNGWEEGSPEKIALHALVGGIMADLGGASALSGAAGAGLNEALQKELKEKCKDQPDLWQWASAAIGGAAAAIVGGDSSTGASAAESGTKNNAELDRPDPTLSLVTLLIGYEVVSMENGKKAVQNAAGEVVAVYDDVKGWLSEAGDYIGKTMDDLVVWAKSDSSLKINYNQSVEEGIPADKHTVVNGKSLPRTGEPNSSADILNPDGSVKQRRYYDGDGNADWDIDYNHSGDNHTFPHKHKWGEDGRGEPT